MAWRAELLKGVSFPAYPQYAIAKKTGQRRESLVEMKTSKLACPYHECAVNKTLLGMGVQMNGPAEVAPPNVFRDDLTKREICFACFAA